MPVSPGEVSDIRAVLEQLALWVEGGDNHRIKKQLQVLETEHSRLYREYRATPREMMRARCLEEIERKEREIGELKMNGMDEIAESLTFLRYEHDVFPGVMTMADGNAALGIRWANRRALPRDDLCRRGICPPTDVILALFSGN